MAKHVVNFVLNSETDKDILRWLARQENRSAAVREAIRAHIKGGGVTLSDVYQAVKDLERKVQDEIVPYTKEAWIFAGTVYRSTVLERIETEAGGIEVAPLFYKMVIVPDSQDKEGTPTVFTFLFPHHKESLEKTHEKLHHYLVPLDTLEILTGLDFLHELEGEVDETYPAVVEWQELLKSAKSE